MVIVHIFISCRVSFSVLVIIFIHTRTCVSDVLIVHCWNVQLTHTAVVSMQAGLWLREISMCCYINVNALNTCKTFWFAVVCSYCDIATARNCIVSVLADASLLIVWSLQLPCVRTNDIVHYCNNNNVVHYHMKNFRKKVTMANSVACVCVNTFRSWHFWWISVNKCSHYCVMLLINIVTVALL